MLLYFVQNTNVLVLLISVWRYKPPETWGKNGHLQTIVSSKLRFNSFKLEGDRHYLKVSNGATLSFDIYEPVEDIIKGTLLAQQ